MNMEAFTSLLFLFKHVKKNYEVPLCKRTFLYCIFFLPVDLSVQGPLLLTWINFDPRIPSKVWDEITYPFPNFNGAMVEVWECISNFIAHLC